VKSLEGRFLGERFLNRESAHHGADRGVTYFCKRGAGGYLVPKYRVYYRRGSFTLADHCENYGEAVARALYLKSQRGVWTVRLEDVAGGLVCGDFDLEGPEPASGVNKSNLRSTMHDQRWVPGERIAMAANSIQ